MGRQHGGVTPGTQKWTVLQILKGLEGGSTTEDMARLVDNKMSNVGEVLLWLVRGGHVVSVLDPKGKAAHRKRYFAAEFSEQAAAFKRQREAKLKPKKPVNYGLRLDPNTPAVQRQDVRVTVGPAFTGDTRFAPTPAEVAPLFSCLSIGRYLDRDTWATRAYGGGR